MLSSKPTVKLSHMSASFFLSAFFFFKRADVSFGKIKSCSAPADFCSLTEERSGSPAGCRASPSATYMQCLDPSGERTSATIRLVFYLFVDKICFFLRKKKKLSCVILSYHSDSFPRQESRLVVALKSGADLSTDLLSCDLGQFWLS